MTCLEFEIGDEHGVVDDGDIEVVVVVVMAVRFCHLTHVCIDLVVAHVTLVVLRNTVACRGDAS